jgi:hypothetical protein
MAKKKQLKLYVWEGVLTDWTSGMAVALASSPEEAVELLQQQLGPSYFNGVKLEGVEPIVVESPAAFFVYGGG